MNTKRTSIKVNDKTALFLKELSLKLSKRGKRVYVGEILDEVGRKLKGKEWNVDYLAN